MRIAGIICEYDPFHNGHKLHIEKTRALGYDKIVCVMSGHITQRGELAALSKWDRASAALLNGADMVVELPALFSCRTADKFADAGVRLLNAVGVDAVSFGSEIDDMGFLRELAATEDDKFAIREALSRGETLAKARAISSKPAPNVTLGIEYIKALSRLGDNAPVPIAVKRDVPHFSSTLSNVCSASAIRSAVQNGDALTASQAVPANAAYQIELMEKRRQIDDMFLNAVRSLDAIGLAQINDVTEGLENRFISAFREAATLNEALGIIKCKRYTYARISRIAVHSLTGLTKAFAEEHDKPEYIRAIGIRDDNRDLTSEMKSRSTLPIVSVQDVINDPVFMFENKVTDIWALTRTLSNERKAGQEFTRKFVRI